MSNWLFAIDPGTEKSGWCKFDLDTRSVAACGIAPNSELLGMVLISTAPRLAIEWIESQGMAVGKETFITVRWIGRFQQAWRYPEAVELITRRQVKLHLCGSMRAKDANIRQAIIDELGPVGTKKAPGPCYGVASHVWSALAVALTAASAAKG